ncbi:MAG: TIM barrel protein [Lentisphaeria bacterium]|nr:TIM barrel protein [Lentisphaeria bacterium]
MKLSLSGRLVENGGASDLSLRAFLELAVRNGYDAVDLRASQVKPDTLQATIDALANDLAELGLEVFELQYAGGFEGDDAAVFAAFAERAASLGAVGIRVNGDVPALGKAARLAAPAGVNVLYQMHTGGAFETIASAAQTIEEIGEPNFGVLPEPANLMMASETFSTDMFAPLADHVFGVHVQTLLVGDQGENTLKLADGTPVSYSRVPFADNTQTPWQTFFDALRAIGFDGHVNELEPHQDPAILEQTAAEAAAFLRPLL